MKNNLSSPIESHLKPIDKHSTPLHFIGLTPIELHPIVEIDYSSQKIVAIEPMNVVCQYCKAFKIKNKAPRLCCARGQVKLTPFIPLSEPLHSLVSRNRPDSKYFLTHM
ncbi:unnamed protein product [Psylliodes chrysocephalus]|uniref:Uncharacterized protein n=1 Tax=Psylliodes chrysocephalus TaxID=3402493 RepID=A0A9P0CTV9_9CUCU|nr:unnamed protein product [Psylliodes chrysocephala]